MVVGSLVGAIVGGTAVAIAPTAFLKVFLGAVLVVAGIKSMRHASD